ncbi:hypothetical protein [Companilactobacillus sp.]|uniref:hypothetical protein n=1 Tax=Companilactobacillus sp. TaxID=2767905 RepID=UPI00262B3DEF|nr:hypothetical protein [Companilactobacillus sp.]
MWSQWGTSKAVGAAPSLNDLVNGLKDFVNNIIQEVQKNNQQNNQDTTYEGKANAVIASIKDVNYDENHAVKLTKDAVENYMYRDMNSMDFANMASNIGMISTQDQHDTIVKGNKQTYTFSSADPKLTKDDLEKAIDNLKNGNGASVKFNIGTKNESGKVINTKTVTFTNNAKTVSSTRDLKIDFNSPINVAVGSKTLDVKLSGNVAANTTVTNGHGNNVAYEANALGFYPSATDARNNTNELNIGGNFNQKGATYYQPVMLKFDRDVVDVYNLLYSSDTTADYSFLMNGQRPTAENIDKYGVDNSVTYVREITVGKEDTKPNDNNNNNNQNNNGNKDDNQKPTNPADPVGVWKTEDHNGIVAVGSHVADLVDEDSSYTTRSLAPHTKWQTNATRVNTVTGAKQYRVSTNEWVSAEDVNFQDAAPKFFNNVLQYPGYQTVHLAGPNGFIYALFNQDGVRLDRALQGDSAWATDERATDFDGNIYYRVSTNEWVKTGNGVSVN